MIVHTIRRFEEELNELKSLIMSMGGLVENAIAESTKAFLELDTKLAQKVIDRDAVINSMEVQCDELIRHILVRRQPAASDMRFIISATKIVTDLERLGDLAEGIAKRTFDVHEVEISGGAKIVEIAELVAEQVHDALDALARQDIYLAFRVISEDQDINTRYQNIFRDILTYVAKDQENISCAVVLASIAKNLERIGDHATNIAEMVIYMVKGHDIRHVDNETAAALLRGEET